MIVCTYLIGSRPTACTEIIQWSTELINLAWGIELVCTCLQHTTSKGLISREVFECSRKFCSFQYFSWEGLPAVGNTLTERMHAALMVSCLSDQHTCLVPEHQHTWLPPLELISHLRVPACAQVFTCPRNPVPAQGLQQTQPYPDHISWKTKELRHC